MTTVKIRPFTQSLWRKEEMERGEVQNESGSDGCRQFLALTDGGIVAQCLQRVVHRPRVLEDLLMTGEEIG